MTTYQWSTKIPTLACTVMIAILTATQTCGYCEIALQRCDCYHALSQMYDFGSETHPGGGDTSAFVFPSAAIAQVLSSILLPAKLIQKAHKVQLIQKTHKGSDHTVVHSLMLTFNCTCRNSPCWWKL